MKLSKLFVFFPMSGIKSVLVRHSPEDPPIVSELVNSLVTNDEFSVKFALVKKGQVCVEASFIPSGFVTLRYFI